MATIFKPLIMIHKMSIRETDEAFGLTSQLNGLVVIKNYCAAIHGLVTKLMTYHLQLSIEEKS